MNCLQQRRSVQSPCGLTSELIKPNKLKHVNIIVVVEFIGLERGFLRDFYHSLSQMVIYANGQILTKATNLYECVNIYIYIQLNLRNIGHYSVLLVSKALSKQS